MNDNLSGKKRKTDKEMVIVEEKLRKRESETSDTGLAETKVQGEIGQCSREAADSEIFTEGNANWDIGEDEDGYLRETRKEVYNLIRNKEKYKKVWKTKSQKLKEIAESFMTYTTENVEEMQILMKSMEWSNSQEKYKTGCDSWSKIIGRKGQRSDMPIQDSSQSEAKKTGRKHQPPERPTESQGKEYKEKSPKGGSWPAPPRTAAVVLTEEENSVAELLRSAKKKIFLEGMGIPHLEVKRAKTGGSYSEFLVRMQRRRPTAWRNAYFNWLSLRVLGYPDRRKRWT